MLKFNNALAKLGLHNSGMRVPLCPPPHLKHTLYLSTPKKYLQLNFTDFKFNSIIPEVIVM